MPPDPTDSHALNLLEPSERDAIADEGGASDNAALAKIIADSGAEQKPAEEDTPAAPAPSAAAPAATPAPAPASAPAATAPAAPAPAAQAAPAAAAAPDAPAVAPAAAAAAAPAPADDDDDEFDFGYVAPLPANFDDQMKLANEAKLDLRKKYKAGDIEIDEYEDQREAAEAKVRELERLRQDHDMSEKVRDQAVQSARARAERKAKVGARAEGIDYDTDKVKSAQWATFVRALAADPANNERSFGWFFNEAHKHVKAMHGIAAAPAPAPAALTPEQVKAAALAARKPPPVSSVPQTLGNVPGAEAPGDMSGNEFEEVDRLEGDAYEDALLKMPAEVRARYLDVRH